MSKHLFLNQKKKKEMKKIEILLTVGQSCVHKSFKKKIIKIQQNTKSIHFIIDLKSIFHN